MRHIVLVRCKRARVALTLRALIGRTIGNYRIVRVLGKGATGVVYLAEHPLAGKRIALKVLRPDLAKDRGLVSRFFQEARAVNEVRHPNVVDISDFGHTEDGIIYYVMEVMEGRSLRDRLAAEGPLPLMEVAAIGRQVCGALAATHRTGIIYGDLKPDKIFLLNAASPGEVRAKLFDFGSAMMPLEKGTYNARAEAPVATNFYMSPERALGHELSAATDIYSIGAVLFEAATGRPPLHIEQSVPLFHAILKQPAPVPSEIRREIPPWMDRLLLRCLEKDPAARPQSMEEVAAMLGAGSGEPNSPIACRPTATRSSVRRDGPLTSARVERDGPLTSARVGRDGPLTSARVGRTPAELRSRLGLRTETSAPATDDRDAIFICYRREDSKHISGRIFDRLHREFGDDHVFIDWASLRLGEDFDPNIHKWLEQSRVALIVIGRTWTSCADEHGPRLQKSDDYVRMEVESALRGCPIVLPVLVDGAQMPKENEVPESIRPLVRREAAKILDERGFDWSMEQLIKFLRLQRIGSAD